MNYDDWKAREPDNRWDDPRDARDQNEPRWEDELDWPQDAFHGSSIPSDIEYKERVIVNLLNEVHEYLQFGTFRELIKLIVDEVT